MMQTITTIDTHTMGQPTRIVTGGIGEIPGHTIREKQDYAASHLDHIRKALMHEPRGHHDMFGAIWQKPVDTSADLGVIFMDTYRYLDMCGHGLIGVITAAIESGFLTPTEGKQVIRVETPAGLVEASATIAGGNVNEVSFRNVPSFLYRKDIPVKLPGRNPFLVDISYGGSYFALVNAEEINLVIETENVSEIIAVGMEIQQVLNESLVIKHPLSNMPDEVKLVEFYAAPLAPKAHARNAVVFGMGQLDRSPCGTGTCAKMAALHARGKLGLNQDFIHESIIGTCFRGSLIEEVMVGALPAVVPVITGQAFVTGHHQFQIHPGDPFKHGFRL